MNQLTTLARVIDGCENVFSFRAYCALLLLRLILFFNNLDHLSVCPQTVKVTSQMTHTNTLTLTHLQTHAHALAYIFQTPCDSPTKVEDVCGGVHQCVAQDSVAHDLVQQDILVQGQDPHHPGGSQPGEAAPQH